MVRIFFLLLFPFLLIACGSFDNASSEICFVGDSITNLWDIEKYFPENKINKHAVSGAILEDVSKWGIADCEAIPTVMLIGTNNLAYGLESDTLKTEFVEDFLKKYVAQVKAFKSSHFYAISILPRNFRHKESESINKEIVKLNGLIKKALKDSKLNFNVIDVFDDFIETENKIHWDYYSDGLHLSEEGYELLSFKVRKAL